MQVWINIYRSGFYHREGKPDHLNAHGGDCFATQFDAMRNVHPLSHYLATISLDVPGFDEQVNPPASVPVPLIYSRKRYFKAHENEEAVHVS